MPSVWREQALEAMNSLAHVSKTSGRRYQSSIPQGPTICALTRRSGAVLDWLIRRDENETVTHPEAGSAPGFIEVYQDRAWFGDPKLAVFNVYLDKKRIGKVPLQSSVRLSVAPGQHRLRIRQWYYGSRPIAVTIEPGETKTFRADVPNKEGVRGIGRMAFKPTRCLVVQPESGSGAELEASQPLPTQRSTTLEGQEQIRQSMVIGGAMAFLGF